MEALRLPRRVEEEPAGEALARGLAARSEALWSGAQLHVPRAEIDASLQAALASAFSRGQLVRGLEDAARVLAAEERGLAHVDRTTGVTRGGRVSRLLLLTDDGSDRFYRSVESLVRQHEPRVLALRLHTDKDSLGQLIFGPGQSARLVLVEHKHAVSALLLALTSQFEMGDENAGPT